MAPYSYDRRTASTEPVRNAFDLQRMLDDRASGWRDTAPGHGDRKYIKRIDGIWYEVAFRDSSSEVFISPTHYPRSIPTLGLDTVREKVEAHLPIAGLTLDKIEHTVKGLVHDFKVLSGPRQPKDRTGLWWKEWRGPEALVEWRKAVRAKMQDIIDTAAPNGIDFTTVDLIEDILENRRMDLSGMSRADMARNIKALLEAMAREKTIEKDTNERLPKWLGWGYKSKPRF